MKIAPVVLIFGKDVGAVSDEVARVRKSVLEPNGASTGLEAFNHERFEGPYVKEVRAVLTACATVPVGAGPRLVELSAPESLGKLARRDDDGTGSAPRPEQEMDALLAYVDDPSPSTVLLLSSTEINKTSKLYKAASKSKQAQVVERAPEKNDDVAARKLADLARERQQRLSPAAARRIVELVGTTTAETVAALGHAAAYAGDGEITLEVVDAIVEHRREDPIWDLTDALGNRDASRALVLLARMFGAERSDAIYGLVPALASHLRKVYAAKVAHGRAHEVLGGPAFVVQKLERQARSFDEGQLRDAVAGLARLDAQTKGACRGAPMVYAAPLVAMQRWVLQVCGQLPGTEPATRIEPVLK